MNLTTILQMQKDRSNGVVLSQPSIDKLIGHALMREIESERLTQALTDSNLALMQAQEVAQAQAPVAAAQSNPHAATFPAEIWLNVGDGDAHEVGPYKDLSELSWCWENIDRYDVRYVRADLAAPQQHAQPSALMVFDGDSTDQPVVEATAERLLKSRQMYPKNAQAALSDDDIVSVLHSLGIDTNKSRYGFDVLQVSSTTVPAIRNVVERCNAILAARQSAPVASAPAVGQPIEETNIDALMGIFLAASGAQIPVLLSPASILALNARVNGTDKFIEKPAAAPVAAVWCVTYDGEMTKNLFLGEGAAKDCLDQLNREYPADEARRAVVALAPVAAAVQGEAPHGNWPEDYRDVLKNAEAVAHQQGRAAGLNQAANKLQSLSDDSTSDAGMLFFAEAAAAVRAIKQ